MQPASKKKNEKSESLSPLSIMSGLSNLASSFGMGQSRERFRMPAPQLQFHPIQPLPTSQQSRQFDNQIDEEGDESDRGNESDDSIVEEEMPIDVNIERNNLYYSLLSNPNKERFPPQEEVIRWLNKKYKRYSGYIPRGQLIRRQSVYDAFLRYYDLFYSVFNRQEFGPVYTYVMQQVGKLVRQQFNPGLTQLGSGSKREDRISCHKKLKLKSRKY